MNRSIQKSAVQFFSFPGSAISAAVILAISVFAGEVFAGEPFSYTEFRQAADTRFQGQLNDLAKICDQQNLTDQASVTRDWFVKRDPKRQYVFLPPDFDPHRPEPETEKPVLQWYQAFTRIRSEQADWLFSQARQHHLMFPSLSYRLLHETLHENPDHPEARKMLGFEQIKAKPTANDQENDGRIEWIKRTRAITTRKVKLRSPALPDKLLWQAQSENFKIITTGDRESAVAVAGKFERWYEVWQQLFFTFWAAPRQLEQMFKGDPPRTRSRRHVVIVYESKTEYDTRLSPLIPGVEVSSGYYDHKLRQSFFFTGEGSDESTWRHELTHQLFQELVRNSRSGRGGPADEHGVWALEGIAMYMESLRDFDLFATVGGFESPRLQYARLDRFRMQYRPEPELLMEMGLKKFQQRPDVAKLYTVSAGYSHFLMDAEGGKYRQALMEYLSELYSGKSKPLGMLEAIELNSGVFDKEYAKFLFVDEQEVVDFLRRPRDLSILSLVPGNVGDRAAISLSNATNLELLDLTASKITDEGVAELAGLEKLSQLFLEKTNVGDESMNSIATLKNLQELDLAQTNVSSDSLSSLALLPRLKVLWLTGTPIDDSALPHLRRLNALQQLDVSGTGISETERKKLAQEFSGD